MRMKVRSHVEKHRLAVALASDPVVRIHLDSLESYPRLSEAEEVDLGRIIADPMASDRLRQVALDRLVEGNLRLAIWAVLHIQASTFFFDYAEALCEANLALIEAAKDFDPSKGRFSTYALTGIFWALQRGIYKTRKVVISDVRIRQMIEVHAATMAHEEKCGGCLTEEELAEKTGIPVNVLAKVPRVHHLDLVVSLDELLEAENEEDEGSAWEPCCEQEECPECSPVLTGRVRSMWESLTDRERDILSRRIGMTTDHEETLQEIADSMNPPVSRERVRQIEEKAWRKARHPKWGIRPSFAPDDLPAKGEPTPLPKPKLKQMPVLPLELRPVEALGLTKKLTQALSSRWPIVQDLTKATSAELLAAPGVGITKALLVHRVLLSFGLPSKILGE